MLNVKDIYAGVRKKKLSAHIFSPEEFNAMVLGQPDNLDFGLQDKALDYEGQDPDYRED